MKKKALILGIETSCDETAAAVLEESAGTIPNLLSNIVSSQEEIHKKLDGVVPELAARSHIDKIDLIVNEALKKSGKKLKDIDQPIWNEFRLIHYAVIQNNIKLFDKLIKKKAKLNLINSNSETAIFISEFKAGESKLINF